MDKVEVGEVEVEVLNIKATTIIWQGTRQMIVVSFARYNIITAC